nr:tripartite tricarboxylate transporter substrate-binding protein [Cupriavidus yeoncheonensis]
MPNGPNCSGATVRWPTCRPWDTRHEYIGRPFFASRSVRHHRNLPKPVVARYNQALVRALANPEVRRKMAEFGSEPVGEAPEHFTSFLVQDRKMWADVIQSARITLE